MPPIPLDPTILSAAGTTRRDFLCLAALTIAGAVTVGSGSLRAAAKSRTLFTGVGITARPDRFAEMKAAGADFVVPPVADFLMPDAPEADFERQLEQLASTSVPVLGCNIFLGHQRLRSTGPNADHAAVLAFSDIAFRRLARAGGKYIGFGSSGSRRLPDGWSKEQGDEQFRALLSAMGPVAARHGIIVAVEQLRTAECNYINRLREVVDVVRPVNHPNIRVLADIYHMAVMGDTPADLEQVMPLLALVEIAEKETRTVPGVAGDDFRPFFAVLARGGYSGPITIEGNGTPEQIKSAFATIRRQAADATG